MTHEELDAYARYLLMPLKNEPQEPSFSAPTFHCVSWRNPFSRETPTRWGASTILTKNGWCKNRFRSSWVESFRHYDREEFQQRLQQDERFRKFLGLHATQ